MEVELESGLAQSAGRSTARKKPAELGIVELALPARIDGVRRVGEKQEH